MRIRHGYRGHLFVKIDHVHIDHGHIGAGHIGRLPYAVPKGIMPRSQSGSMWERQMPKTSVVTFLYKMKSLDSLHLKESISLRLSACAEVERSVCPLKIVLSVFCACRVNRVCSQTHERRHMNRKSKSPGTRQKSNDSRGDWNEIVKWRRAIGKKLSFENRNSYNLRLMCQVEVIAYIVEM